MNNAELITGAPNERTVCYAGEPLDPAPSQKVWNHSPDGFNWGYTGSGPAQLSLAILLRHTGYEELAVRAHQFFKRDMIATLDINEPFSFPISAVADWLESWSTT